MKKSLLNYSFELVAPMTAIGSILLLPLGPLLLPKCYLIFLLAYFTCFLYTQVNHVFKFYITASKMKRVIRQWNQPHDEGLADMENAPLYDDSHFIHAFIIPNYEEPEGLLRDTIKRLANYKYEKRG
jgi:hypothetical protein